MAEGKRTNVRHPSSKTCTGVHAGFSLTTRIAQSKLSASTRRTGEEETVKRRCLYSVNRSGPDFIWQQMTNF